MNLIGYITVVYLTNGFHVAVRLFSNRSQMTSKCGKNKKVAHEAQPSVSLMCAFFFACGGAEGSNTNKKESAHKKKKTEMKKRKHKLKKRKHI